MYYIKKGKKVVATSDPDEVTKENFVCEPGAENRVWCKLEKYEFDRETGTKKAVVNQVRADNPGDFERFAPIWKNQGMTITMLHDPREGMEHNSVAAKLAKLNAAMDENQNENENGETPTEEDWKKTVEAKEQAEERAVEAEARLAELEAKMKAAAEAEAKAKAEEEARLKAEEEAKAKAEETPAPSFEEAQGNAPAKPVKKSSK